LKIGDLKNKWNDYFFKEVPVDGICLFRIIFGIIVLSTFFQDALYYKEFWGPEAIQSATTSMKNYPFPILNIFQYFEVTNLNVLVLCLTLITTLSFFIVGFKTRTMAFISFILLVSFNQRTINMLSSADLLIRIILGLMIFSPAGHKFSLDAKFAKLKGKVISGMHAPWVHRLIQLQIAVVYISTIIAKSHGNTWIDGSAVYYSTRLTDFERFTVPLFLDWMWSIKFMTWSALIVEFSLGTLIFIDELRRPLIIIGIFFHLGIEYMMAIPTFEWLMIVCLLGMFKLEDYKIFSENYLIPLLKNYKSKLFTKLT